MKVQSAKCKVQSYNIGFSLVEILIVAGIGLVVGALLVSIMVSSNGIFYKQNSIVEEGLSLNDVSLAIENQIKQAVQISEGYPPVSPIYITDAKTLVLKLPAIDNNGVLSGLYDYLVVTKDSANSKILLYKVFPDASSIRESENKILLRNLESHNFEYLDQNDATVSATSAIKVRGKISVLSKTGSVGETRSMIFISSLRNL